MNAPGYDRAAVARLADEWLPPGTKGIPLATDGLTVEEFVTAGIDALAGELPTPLLLIRETALEGNIATMAAFCERHGALLAPHGKTTMAPQIFARQIEAGAWAITAATPTHARLYRRFGIGRIFLANELVDEAAVRWLCEEIRRDPSFEFFSLVDSLAGVRRLDQALASASVPRPFPVLLEVGYSGGRTGVRDGEAAELVARAVAAAPNLELVGVELFEGLMPGGQNVGETIDAIERWLDDVGASVGRLMEQGLLPERPLLSGGGSAYFDRVLDKLGDLPAQVVLRSGCYVTQDGGFYEATSPLAGRASGPDDGLLQNALELWSRALSRPEPGRVIADFGKRDAPWDMGMPTLAGRRTADGSPAAVEGAEVVALNDQHAHVALPATSDLAVGDLLRFDVSHPCGAFDRWRMIPVVDDRDRVIDAVLTFF
jgi:D-serine dehydratase